MDFSPYRKTANPYKKNVLQKIAIPLFLGVAAIAGFLIFWGAQKWSGGNQSSVLAIFEQNGVTAQTQVNGMNSWARLSDQSFIAEGDRVRITEGNGAKISLGANSQSYLILGEDSEVLFTSIKHNVNNEVSGEIVVERGPVFVSADTAIDEEHQLKIWGSGREYIALYGESVLIDDNTAHSVNGESIQAVKVDIDGKITLQKSFGIGQSLNLSTFSLFATPNEIQYSPLLSEGGSLPTPSSEGLPESSTLQAPTLLSPEFSGTLISVEGTSQKITGTAPLEAEKILVSFEHKGVTEELFISLSESLSGENQEWEYTASTSIETLKPGINTYNIYSIDSEGKRSAARVLVLEYKEEVEENLYSESTGEFLITAPNQGRDATVTGDTVVITGVATSDTAFITVNNKTRGSSYTLQEYTEGQKTWRYWTSSLQPGEYDYVIQAKDKNKKVIHTQSITITLQSSSATSPTVASTPLPSVEPSSTQGGISESPTPEPTVSISPTPTTSPAINTSSKEAERDEE